MIRAQKDKPLMDHRSSMSAALMRRHGVSKPVEASPSASWMSDNVILDFVLSRLNFKKSCKVATDQLHDQQDSVTLNEAVTCNR